MSAQVFISYPSADRQVAGLICAAIERRKIGCWISNRDVAPGENFQEAIVAAIEAARVMVFVFSKGANASREMQKELAIASQHGLAVIPVRVEDVVPNAALRYEFSTRQWIDLFDDWDSSMQRLTSTIETILAGRGEASDGEKKRDTPPPAVPAPRRSWIAWTAGAAALLAIVAGGSFGAYTWLQPGRQDPAKRSASLNDVARPQPGQPSGPPIAVQEPPALAATASPNPPREVAAPPREAAAEVPKAPAAPAVAVAPPPPAAVASPPTAAAPSVVATIPPMSSAPPAEPTSPIRPPPLSATLPVKPPAEAAPEVAPVSPAPSLASARDGQRFRECVSCPEMVVLPPGAALLGAPAGERGRVASKEFPQREVRFAEPLAISRYPVTFAEWDACVAEGGCDNWVQGDSGWGRGRRPAIFVSFTDASGYVAWLSKKTGGTYRLVSETEWEYATRGCRTTACASTAFWFGNDIAPEIANYNANFAYAGSSKATPRKETIPVDEGAANPFGLVQAAGNVRQWVADCWTTQAALASKDGASVASGDCTRHVVRGGSWYDEPVELRSAARSWELADERTNRIGFRIARTLVPETSTARADTRSIR